MNGGFPNLIKGIALSSKINSMPNRERLLQYTILYYVPEVANTIRPKKEKASREIIKNYFKNEVTQ